LHYQWNKSLDGAHHWYAVANNSDSTSYTPVAGDIGYHLKVVVTASTAGYVDAIVTSNISATIVAPPIVTFWDPPLNQSITSNPTPRFNFSSAPGVSFRCSVDTGAATTCASPFTTPSLSDGAHLLNVYSIDSGVTGPTASYSFTVDTVAPVIANLSISAGPSYSASWIETATVGTVVSFVCQLDSASPVPCTSPYTIGTLSGSGSYNFKVTGRDLAGNSGQTTTSLVGAPAPPTTYAIGATGPGGGIVFYVSPTPFTETGAPCANSCHYLEAAPTSGPNAWTEISRGWSGNGLSLIGTTSTVFGSGYSNTQTLIHQPGAASDGAAFLAQAYSGPSALNDWFLPSKDELNELYLQQINVGGWLFQTHWSSSEWDQYSAWTQLITIGLQIHDGKLFTYAVRPIRAF
jgi:hypothetical protein